MDGILGGASGYLVLQATEPVHTTLHQTRGLPVHQADSWTVEIRAQKEEKEEEEEGQGKVVKIERNRMNVCVQIHRYASELELSNGSVQKG